MASLAPLLFMAAVAGVIAAVMIAAQRAKARRREDAHALAARYGFSLDVDDKPPPPQRFDLFGIGSSRTVSFQFWRPGERHSVFAYQYVTGSGDSRTTHRHTCALIALPFDAPHTKIGPEGFWSTLGKQLGIRDIEVESPEFNRRLKVDSDDERFAITMLDGRAIYWFSNQHHNMKFEFWGPWMLCIAEKMDLERYFGYLDWAIGVPAHLPDVLTSLYPA